MEKLKNNFRLSEWSGAIGDLGTLLPLSFALVAFNGFDVSRIFLLFGIVYIVSGFIYKVPVSVQPLKAMSVIAISSGLSIEFLSGTAVFYGILLVLLSVTGAIRWLQKWFSAALVKGIQLGIGLILFQKAIELVSAKGWFLASPSNFSFNNYLLLIGFSILIAIFQFRKNIPIALVLIFLSIVIVKLLNIYVPPTASGIPYDFVWPDISILPEAIILLIIPQLPLTLGNAMFAASDACYNFWGKQSRRVTPTRLGMSIGLSDIFIGLSGGFPMCHGAGGIAAHKQFGAKTGGATIIMGSVLILFALISPFTSLLFLIPVPLLAAMLLFDSWRMIMLVKKLGFHIEIVVAFVVGLISFFTRNISVALVAGLALEQSYNYLRKRKKIQLEN